MECVGTIGSSWLVEVFTVFVVEPNIEIVTLF